MYTGYIESETDSSIKLIFLPLNLLNNTFSKIFDINNEILKNFEFYDDKIPENIPQVINPKKILPDPNNDIMYQDSLVCILKPNVKKGIIVWTSYMDSSCKLGLKTGFQLHSEGFDIGRSNLHEYIFFKAPFYSRDIDYSSVENEIISSYGEVAISGIYIRVDPEKTMVFSSEIRAKKSSVELYKSGKLMSNYLRIISENAKKYKTLSLNEIAAYDLLTSELIPLHKDNTELEYPLDNSPIETNSEILINIPHLTPDYFVLCTNSDELTE
jgi:hypothetical protein